MAEIIPVFKRSLGAINLWYAHQKSTIYIVSDKVPGLLPYSVRGWTTFEYLLSMLIKVSNESAASDWPQVVLLGSDEPLRRPPPAEPLAFCAGHEYGAKIYTNGADRDAIVAPKFKATIEEVMGGVEELNYSLLGWGEKGSEAAGMRAAPV